MFARHLAPVLRARAARMPVVTLLGPRQSGKTTLARETFPDLAYVSLEPHDLRAEAREDPRGFLARFSDGAILDEVHRAPDLLSYLQTRVDADPRPGRFVLTASQNLLLMERVSQTLAGRTAILRLLPLSLPELLGRPAPDPDRIDEPREPGEAAEAPSRDLWETLWTGFYPRIHDRGLPPDEWLADYERTYVERDVREVIRILDLDAFQRFVRIAASRTGQELKLSSLASDAGVSQPTAKAWLGALRIGGIVQVVLPHHVNFGKRLRKQPKLHFVDTGLACHLLGIRDSATLRLHPLRGAIFETFVAGELAKAFENAGRDPPLFFWKDLTGHELDLLVDLGTRLVGVEAKSGQTVAADALDALRWWLALPGNDTGRGVLVHGGAMSSARGGIAVRPWFAVA